MNSAKVCRGFTLIELLIALGLSALVVAGLHAVIYSTVQRAVFLQDSSQRLREAQLLFETIEEDLRNFVSCGPAIEGTEDSVSFTAMIYVRDVRAALSRPAIALITYSWETDAGGRR